MALVQAFALLYRDEKLPQTLFELVPGLQEEIPMASLHLLVRILHCQQASGGWDEVCEVTAYAIFALSSMARLPWIRQLGIDCIITAVERGKLFLLSNRNQWSKGHYLWIEKVTYASKVLFEAYCLAAALAPIPSAMPLKSEAICSSFQLPDIIMREMRKASGLVKHTPLFSETESYVLRAAEVQAGFALCALQQNPLGIFPRTAKGEDKYMPFIPLALTACAASQGCVVSLSIL
jgi:hypothetical protein